MPRQELKDPWLYLNRERDSFIDNFVASFFRLGGTPVRVQKKMHSFVITCRFSLMRDFDRNQVITVIVDIACPFSGNRVTSNPDVRISGYRPGSLDRSRFAFSDEEMVRNTYQTALRSVGAVEMED